MKFLRLIITTLVLCVFNSHSVSSQERTVEDVDCLKKNIII